MHILSFDIDVQRSAQDDSYKRNLRTDTTSTSESGESLMEDLKILIFVLIGAVIVLGLGLSTCFVCKKIVKRTAAREHKTRAQKKVKEGFK